VDPNRAMMVERTSYGWECTTESRTTVVRLGYDAVYHAVRDGARGLTLVWHRLPDCKELFVSDEEG